MKSHLHTNSYRNPTEICTLKMGKKMSFCLLLFRERKIICKNLHGDFFWPIYYFLEPSFWIFMFVFVLSRISFAFFCYFAKYVSSKKHKKMSQILNTNSLCLPRFLTFFCSNSSQLMFSKKACPLISFASVGPPPNLLAGSLTEKTLKKNSCKQNKILNFFSWYML